jgi:hypothetical protein
MNMTMSGLSEHFERERSVEEEDTLSRSTKKYKDRHESPAGSHKNTEKTFVSSSRSYKDRLVGAIPGAYEQAFGFVSSMQADEDSDDEAMEPGEGCVLVGLSREEKLRIHAPWAQSLIVKTFGRNVGFMFLSSKVKALWSPLGPMDCIDIGHDYYLIKFELKADLDNVLKGGPWFVGQNFLAIRQWEPDFQPSTANFSSVAVWVRLLELPIEYYEPSLLKKIGHAIGPVLRIDAHTMNGARGKFARLCIQVNLEKPLPMTVYIGQKRMQPIQYEGINQLCFYCGRIGHRKEGCPFMVRPLIPPSSPGDVLVQHETHSTDGKETFGEWMVVTRKKRPTAGRKPLLVAVVGSLDSTTVKTDVPKDLSGQSLPVFGPREGKRKAHVPIDKVNTQPVLSNSGRQWKGKGKIVTSKLSSSKYQSFLNSSGTNQLETKSKSLSPQTTSSPQPLIFSFGDGGSSRQMGDISKKQSHSGGGRDNRMDSVRSNLNMGLVRSRNQGGMGEHISPHREEQHFGISRANGFGLNSNSKPMVVFPNGSSPPPSFRSKDVSMVCSTILDAHLGKLANRIGRGLGVNGNCSKKDFAPEFDGMYCDGQPNPSEASPILFTSDRVHLTGQKLSGA